MEALVENDQSAQCVVVSSWKEATRKLGNNILPLPDAIFLDLNMPRINGIQGLREIKQTSLLNNIPVIIYSTSSSKKDMQETLQLGASYFLTKKSNFEELRKELSVISSRLENECANQSLP